MLVFGRAWVGEVITYERELDGPRFRPGIAIGDRKEESHEKYGSRIMVCGGSLVELFLNRVAKIKIDFENILSECCLKYSYAIVFNFAFFLNCGLELDKTSTKSNKMTPLRN